MRNHPDTGNLGEEKRRQENLEEEKVRPVSGELWKKVVSNYPPKKVGGISK